MPELPEVETIKDDLTKVILNKTIENIEILLKDIIKFPDVSLFQKEVKNRRVKNIYRKGKYLIFTLDSRKELVIHLKLTGQLIYKQAPSEEKFTKLLFHFKEGGYLYFNDRRGFAEIYLVSYKDYTYISGLENLGIEPLSSEFTVEKFEEIVKSSSTKIKSLLMDQEKIAGIGNIYANESLFLSGINPKKTASSLASVEIYDLYHNLVNVIKKALKERGTSVDTYVDAQGNKGIFFPIVYGKEGNPCPNCGTAIKKTSVAGRSTYFCPKCQR